MAVTLTNIYGIFFTGTATPAFEYDTFVEMKFDNKMKVSDFAVEQGSFATYNKVNHPYDIHVQIATSDTADGRHKLLIDLDDALKSVNRFDIVTADATYLNATLSQYTFARRKEHGWGKIIIDLHFLQVREVFAQYTNTRPAGGRGAKNGGQVNTFNDPVYNANVSLKDATSVAEKQEQQYQKTFTTGRSLVNGVGTPVTTPVGTPAATPVAPPAFSSPTVR